MPHVDELCDVHHDLQRGRAAPHGVFGDIYAFLHREKINRASEKCHAPRGKRRCALRSHWVPSGVLSPLENRGPRKRARTLLMERREAYSPSFLLLSISERPGKAKR
jgi:hypothetical protein